MVTRWSVLVLLVLVLLFVCHSPARANDDCATGPGSVPGDIIYEGTEGEARFGTSLGSAGDLNGDGLGDLLVGAPDSCATAPKAGRAFVLFGKPGITGTTQVPPGFGPYTEISTSVPGAFLGTSVAGIGDFDGDGSPDIAVGLPGAPGHIDGDNDDGVAFTGAVQIIYGTDSWPQSIDIDSLSATRVVGAGPAENAGFAVAGAGDINGDGLADLLVGAPRAQRGDKVQAGKAYIIYGRPGRPAVLDLEKDADVTIKGGEAYGRLGWSVAGVGDLNGDGSPDIAIGAPFEDPGGFVNGGRVLVLFGSPNLPPVIDARAPLNGAGFRLAAGSIEERLGWSVAGGDVNADGRPDLIAGAPYSRSFIQYSHGRERGRVYLVFGADSYPETITFFDMASFGVVIEGENDWWRTGAAVAAIGDFNADGKDDFAVGAPRATPASFPNAGALYILFGRPDWPVMLSLHQWPDYGIRIQAKRSRARFASSVAGLGDHSGNEGSDVAAGAPLQSLLGGPCAGQVSVFTGESIPRPTDLVCAPEEDTVKLTWSNPYNYDSVEILRDGELLAQLSGDATTYTDTQVPVGPHTYEVRGKSDGVTTGSVSCEIRIQVPPPASLSCAARGQTVTLTWSLTGSVGGVVVARDGDVMAELPGTATSYEDQGVPFGPHTYEVWTGIDPYESVSASCAVVVVQPPSDLVCEVTGSTVTLRWNEPDPYEKVEITRDGNLLAVFPGGLGTFTETGVPPGEHTYEVRGIIGDNFSDTTSCTVLVVAPPENLSCTASGENATISWSSPVQYDAVHILVPGLGDIVVSGDTTEYIVEGLAAGSYRIEVAGEKDGNLSDPVVCILKILVPPSNLACSAEATVVSLVWENGELYETIVLLRDGQELARLPGGTTAYQDQDVPPGTHTYELFGEVEGSASAVAACEIVVLTPPADLTCSAVADTVTLQWTNTATYESIALYRDGGLVAQLAGDTTQYMDSGVEVGTHRYEIVASFGTSISAAVDCEVVAPGAPFDLARSAEGPQVTLTWQNGDAYSEVKVLRNGEVLASLPGDATQYLDQTAQAGQTYEYEVVGVIDGNLSAPAACSISLPLPPENLACETVGATVRLSWTLPGPAAGVEVLRDGQVVAQLPGDATTFEETVSVPGTYEYGVRTVQGAAISELASCTISTIAPPGDLSCSSRAGTVSITWTVPAGYQELKLYRNGELVAALPGDQTGYEDGPLGPGDYEYEIVAKAGSSLSDPASCSVHAPQPLAELHCLADETGVTLSWSLPEVYDSIVILRNGEELVQLPGTTTTHRDTDVEPGTTYTYEVIGIVDPSSAPAVQCTLTIPRPPVDLVCSAEGTTVHLRWTDTDAYDSIQITRNGTVIEEGLAGDVSEYTDSDLEPGAYNYEVRGRIGESLSGPAACTVNVIPAPGELACAIEPIANEVRLSWTNPMVYDSITVRRNGEVIAQGLDGSTTSYVDQLPTPATWTYEVIGFALGSVSAAAVCQVEVLPPPVLVNCEAHDDTVTLAWTNSWQYQTIHVYRDAVEVAVLEGTVTEWKDEGVPAGTHQYLLYAESETSGVTPPAYCEVEVVSPPADFICAAVVIGLEGRVTLTWSLAGTYDSIVIEREGPEGTDYFGPLPGNATSYVNERVPPGTYTYRAIASIGPSTAASEPCEAEIIPPKLVRGDANHDGRVDVADAIWVFSYLFRDGPPPPCMDAADANDDGRVDLSDAIWLVDFRFRHGPPPLPPYPDPGVDATVDPQAPDGDLGCEASL